MSGEDIDLLPFIFVRFVFFVRYPKHPAVAFVFHSLGFVFPHRQSPSGSHLHGPVLTRLRVLLNLIFVGKLITLFFHSIASLSTESLPVPFWSLLTLMMFHPLFVWIPSIWTDPILLILFHSSIYCLVDGLGLILLTMILPLSELISMPYPATVLSILTANHKLQRGRRWTPTTVRCQPHLHLPLNYLQIGHPVIAAEVSSALSSP